MKHTFFILVDIPRNLIMTSSDGNIFRVTDHLHGELTCHRLIPRTKASDAELWCFFLICVWVNGWINNRDAGNLRRHRAHYDVTNVGNDPFLYIREMDGIHVLPTSNSNALHTTHQRLVTSRRPGYGTLGNIVLVLSVVYHRIQDSGLLYFQHNNKKTS